MREKLRHPDVIAQRERAHAAFDLLHLHGWMTRDEAYAWLASTMRLPRNEAHIGRMSPDQCAAIYDHATGRLRTFMERTKNDCRRLRKLVKRLQEQAAVKGHEHLILRSIAEQCSEALAATAET